MKILQEEEEIRMSKRIASDSMKLSIARMLSLLAMMAVIMILSRYLTLSEYGTYSQLLLVVNLFTTIFIIGLPNSINYFLAGIQSKEEAEEFLSVYYSLSNIIGILIGIVLILCVPLIVKYFNNPYIKSFAYILAIMPWTKTIMQSIDNVLIVSNKTRNVIRYRISHSMIIMLITFAIIVMQLSFEVYMLAYIITEVIFGLIVLLIIKIDFRRIHFSLNRQVAKRIFIFVIPIGFAGILSIINIQLDKMIIGRFFSVEQLAIYANAAKELPVTVIPASITAVLMPNIVRLLRKDRTRRAVDLWKNANILSYSIICILAMIFVVFAPEIITILYSSKYIPGVQVFRVYSIVLLLRITYFGIILNSTGKTKYIMYSSAISLILNIILNYVFYRLFGFIGPAIATLIATASVQVVQLIISGRVINVRLANIFPWEQLIWITVLNFAFGLIFVYIKRIITIDTIINPPVEAVFLSLIWISVYAMIMYKNIRKRWEYLNSEGERSQLEE